LYRTNAYVSQITHRHARTLGDQLLPFFITSIVVLGLLGSVGVYVFQTRSKSSRKTSTSTTSGARSFTVESTERATVEPEPRPDIEPTGTPQQSLRACPEWGRFELLRGSPGTQWAPQPSKPLDLFVSAQPFDRALDHAFVICRVQSFNKSDTFAGDDLQVRATFGRTPEVAQDGPEDANLGFVSAPLVTLKSGDDMRFEVDDRDVFGMDPITRTHQAFAPVPFNAVDSGAAIECRSIAGAALAQAVGNEAAKASDDVAALESETIDPYARSWDHPGLYKAQRSAGDLAALAGWADPRSKNAVKRIDAVRGKASSERAEAFRTLYTAANDHAALGDFDAKLASVTCEHRACTMHLTVTNQTSSQLMFNGFIGSIAYVATESSGQIRAQGSGYVEANASADITLTAELPSANASAILGICNDRRCKPLKLR
jgi:hypothetical protein